MMSHAIHSKAQVKPYMLVTDDILMLVTCCPRQGLCCHAYTLCCKYVCVSNVLQGGFQLHSFRALADYVSFPLAKSYKQPSPLLQR